LLPVPRPDNSPAWSFGEGGTTEVPRPPPKLRPLPDCDPDPVAFGGGGMGALPSDALKVVP